MPCSRRASTKSTTSWLLMTSHTPSQASTKNRSSDVSSKLRTSGSAVMIWDLAGRSPFILYRKSPIARLRFKLPLTRHTPPISDKNPPAAMMRDRSPSCDGLWSSESDTAVLPRQSTPRLSPAFATYSLLPRLSATTAVQPACTTASSGSSLTNVSAALLAAAPSALSGAAAAAPSAQEERLLYWKTRLSRSSASMGPSPSPSSPPMSSSSPGSFTFRPSISSENLLSRSISSMRWKARTKAASMCDCAYSSVLRSSATMWRWQKRATSAPPCPSNTPNIDVSASSTASAMCASSMVRRQPCIPAPPYTTSPAVPSQVSFVVTGDDK
mmetsp:Transcript_19609/g.58142  ORF Transcript_19609/g.58142 Transcript_19609/m.58142 type:complete len:327 (-) Transcript_19609:191-1171(-)